MRKSLFTVIGAAMLIGTSSLALAQYAPSNPVSGAAAGAAGGARTGAATGGAVGGPVGAAVGGAVGTATGAAAGTAAGTANLFAPIGANPGGRLYESELAPGVGGCPPGQMNYKGYCYPNKPAAFTQ